MSRFDLGTVLSNQMPAEQTRDIETITGEILDLKKTAGDAILGIGARLIEAKEILPHGEWQTWLEERVEFSERSAQRFMRLARDWSNPTALSDLGATKALTLLALPPEEREQFMESLHEVDGQEKAVIDMSARELEKAVREREEAKKLASDLQEKLDAAARQHQEELAAARQEAETLREEADRLREAEGQAARDAEDRVSQLTQELEELKAAPVDVAVMAVDQEALDKARAEAVAEMQAKLDKAKEAKAKAEEKRKSVEAALEAANGRVADLEKAAKKAALSSDKELATFELLFLQAQELANKMRGLLLKIRGREDKDAAAGIEKGLLALADAIGRCAE